MIATCTVLFILGGTSASEPTAAFATDRDPIVALGRALFFDDTLSNPQGQSCASCHAPEAGWTHPDSHTNEQSGIAAGAVAERFGSRRPPTIGYVEFMAGGPPVLKKDLGTYVGGFFYDGRAASLVEQIAGPLLNPNEMNHTRSGVVQSVINGPNEALFQDAFGVKASSLPIEEAFEKIAFAIVMFETSPTFSPFRSRYDTFVAGKATLSPSELAGLQLFTGSRTGRPGGAAVKSAGCWTCHTLDEAIDGARDLFSSSTFHNIGLPRNTANPYYSQTNSVVNPKGYNASGDAFVDYGLGSNLYLTHSLPPGNVGKGSDGRGDYLRVNGKFKTPTLRNVDARPSADFIKRYGHNGFFTSLEQVVHFYNTRNLTTTQGEVINFTERDPYARLKGKPLWPPPEVADPATLVNPTGARGLIGNLGLTAAEEADLVAFLRTLNDIPRESHAH